MSVEAGLGFGVKVLGGAFVAVISGAIGHIYYALRRDKTKLDNTYSRQEVNTQIDLKIKPVEVKLQSYDNQLRILTELMEKAIEVQNKRSAENLGAISDIKTDVAVILNEVKNIKESRNAH